MQKRLELIVLSTGPYVSYITKDAKMTITAEDFTDFSQIRQKHSKKVKFGRKSLIDNEMNRGKILFSEDDRDVARDQFQIIVKEENGELEFDITCTAKSTFTSLKLSEKSVHTLQKNDVIYVGEEQLLVVKDLIESSAPVNPKSNPEPKPIDYMKLVEIDDIYIPQDWDDEETYKRKKHFTITLENNHSFANSEQIRDSTMTFDSRISPEIKIGKKPSSEIRYLKQRLIRENHCLIYFDRTNSWKLKDNFDRNCPIEMGTFLMIKDYEKFLNEEPSRPRRLRNDDIIYISKYAFLVKII